MPWLTVTRRRNLATEEPDPGASSQIYVLDLATGKITRLT
jgi:hypothetical protein